LITKDGYDYTINIDERGNVKIYRDDEFVEDVHQRTAVEDLYSIINGIHNDFMIDLMRQLDKLQELEEEANEIREYLGLEKEQLTTQEDLSYSHFLAINSFKNSDVEDDDEWVEDEEEAEPKPEPMEKSIPSFKLRRSNKRTIPHEGIEKIAKVNTILGRKEDVKLSAYGYLCWWHWEANRKKVVVTINNGREDVRRQEFPFSEVLSETEWEGNKSIHFFLVHLARDTFLSWAWADFDHAQEELPFFVKEDIRLECSDKEQEAQEVFFDFQLRM